MKPEILLFGRLRHAGWVSDDAAVHSMRPKILLFGKQKALGWIKPVLSSFNEAEDFTLRKAEFVRSPQCLKHLLQ